MVPTPLPSTRFDCTAFAPDVGPLARGGGVACLVPGFWVLGPVFFLITSYTSPSTRECTRSCRCNDCCDCESRATHRGPAPKPPAPFAPSVRNIVLRFPRSGFDDRIRL